jgi:hypothetical protein
MSMLAMLSMLLSLYFINIIVVNSILDVVDVVMLSSYRVVVPRWVHQAVAVVGVRTLTLEASQCWVGKETRGGVGG